MGLDAFVRCRCFEEGKLKLAPVPADDLYVDDAEGCVSSRLLDRARAELCSEDYRAQYGELEERFWEWEQHPCEHKFSEYCSKHIGNISAWHQLEWLFAEFGEQAPTLANMLPGQTADTSPQTWHNKRLMNLIRRKATLTSLRETTRRRGNPRTASSRNRCPSSSKA